MTVEWLTAAQVGGRVGATAETVKEWARKGDLKGWTTPGGHWRFSAAEVDRFLEERGAA